jgi:hypothetical protein
MTDINRFKSVVKEYIALENKLEEIKKNAKILKERKDMLYEIISSFMKENEIKQVNLPNNQKFQACTKKKRVGLNKKWIEGRLTLYCEEHNLNFDEIYDFIYNNDYRPATEIDSIKKVKGKK